jgi:hypothetical protein
MAEAWELQDHLKLRDVKQLTITDPGLRQLSLGLCRRRGIASRPVELP